MTQHIRSESIPIGEKKPEGKDRSVQQLFNNDNFTILTIALWDGAVLARHHAAEPITVLCLEGSGVFRAGAELEDKIDLRPGTILNLDAGIDHEATAGDHLRILVTKFKNAK